MHSDHHPLLAQVPLTVSPFVTLPRAPTLPHTYASLPSTLPPSILSAPSSSDPEPAYVTSASGFRAHPSTIINQNRALAEQLASTATEAKKSIDGWLESIKLRELAEKRRKAPGYLDSEERILRPERVGEKVEVKEEESLLDVGGEEEGKGEREVSDLGAQMDRAFR